MQINHEALAALKNNQRQLDMDGCEVGVSRQALDEAITFIEAALSAAEPSDAAQALMIGSYVNDAAHNLLVNHTCSEGGCPTVNWYKVRDDIALAIEDGIDAFTARPALSAQVQDVAEERYRHKKRGSIYTVTARGRLQVDGDLDNEKVVVYRGEDGQTWVRPEYEFNDGRFEPLPAAPAVKQGEVE